MMRKSLLSLLCGFFLCTTALLALEKQPAATYHGRRVALASKLKGGVAVLFAAEEPQLDFMPYRQDEDFYYLTGWNEPGAALLIVGDAPSASSPRKYREVLFLPTRNLRLELYTGEKLDAASSGVAQTTGVDEVLPMTDLPKVLGDLVTGDRSLVRHLWGQPAAGQAKALAEWTAATLGTSSSPDWNDIGTLTQQLRVIKDPGELELIKKATEASIAAQRLMMKSAHPNISERAIAGLMLAKMMEEGCERPSYSPIVGSGKNSTVLHYSENSGRLKDGDVLVVDAAGEYSMYASDITRTVPVNGHFTARQKEIYDIVLGAQRAAIAAFVAGKSKINDREHKDPDSLDTAAWNYIHTHGKGPQGELLDKYWLHGLGHMVGIDVHDPADYPALLKPGMVFTIEPGIYIPEEKLGVRIEDVFYIDPDGKLIDLVAALPHTTEEVEAAMHK
jgi:Xaa-Pro aminopeptidase